LLGIKGLSLDPDGVKEGLGASPGGIFVHIISLAGALPHGGIFCQQVGIYFPDLSWRAFRGGEKGTFCLEKPKKRYF
jgi:hypothetical protein